MDLSRRAPKSGASRSHAEQLPVHTDEKGRRRRVPNRIGFLSRPLALWGDSGVSIPLGLAIIFPILILILIIFIFTRQTNSPVLFLMPGGAPPAIRYSIPRRIYQGSTLMVT